MKHPNLESVVSGHKQLNNYLDCTEIYKQNRTVNIEGDNNTIISGNYNLTVLNNSSANSINIKSTNGGIKLESGDVNVYGHEITINSNVKFNNALYYTPEILTSAGTNNTQSNRTIIGQNVLTILSWAGNNTDTIWYLKLNKGRYNGQIKKIALHPQWNGKEVNIAILQFIDPAGNTFTGDDLTVLPTSNLAPAQLLLNSGGQTLNLIYIYNDSVNNGYWMLLDNNFDFI